MTGANPKCADGVMERTVSILGRFVAQHGYRRVLLEALSVCALQQAIVELEAWMGKVKFFSIEEWADIMHIDHEFLFHIVAQWTVWKNNNL